MSLRQELKETERYLRDLGERYSIAQEVWVKDIIRSVMKRRSEILAGVEQ